jgi:MoaA/NifB/PqqE/SkfB family radical SAM enzyme
MIIGRASKHVEEIKPSDEQYVQLIRKIYELNKSSIQVVSNEKKHVLYKNPICIEWGDPLDHIFRYREGNDSCYTTMSIKANGDIAPSPYLPLSIGNIRCHTLQEYWDSGYSKIWKLPILKKMASTLNTVDDMQCDSMGYNTWIDRDYSCDIVDEHLME